MKGITVTIIALLIGPVAAAQTSQQTLEAVVREVSVGDKILVMTSDGAQVSGRLRSLTVDALALDTGKGLETIPAVRVGRIVLKDPVSNGAWIGLVAGAAAGLAGGLLVNAICSNEGGACMSGVLLLTALGAGGGAAIGAGLDGLQHRTVFSSNTVSSRLSSGSVPAMREYAPEAVVNVGFARTTAVGLDVAGPASVGAAWGLQHTSGLGFEFDVSRTIGHSTHMVPCATARSFTPDSAGCVGEGREGVDDTTIGTAKAQYFMKGTRVRPYISGGAAIYESSMSIPFIVPPFQSGTPYVQQTSGRAKGVAGVAGGGVRVALARHLSIRPDVAVYIGKNWTHVRGSVGVGIGW